MNNLEKGEKYFFQIPEIGFEAYLPWVLIQTGGKKMRIASLNLVGMIEWNRILGKAIAQKIRQIVPDLSGLTMFTAVEKALQLSQVVASELGINQIAVAYNRIKPHMEPENRPVVQVSGSGSITSGEKYLVIYERDLNFLSQARKGVILIDDVVSKGGTVAALATILDQVRELKHLQPEAIRVLGVFCVATEGKQMYKIASKIYPLGILPPPEYV